jgi:hypothetical protein
MDQLTAATLSVVRQQLASSAIALVGVAESGRVPQSLSTVPRLPVQPLSAAATAELADRAHLGHVAGTVHDLTAGHPSFVVEALRCGRQGTDLTLELPSMLIETALARIERAGSDVSEGLATYAALGTRFTSADALSLMPDRGPTVLRRATAAGLLLAEGDWFAFESKLLHAAVCTATPAAVRQYLGAAAADACRPIVASAA